MSYRFCCRARFAAFAIAVAPGAHAEEPKPLAPDPVAAALFREGRDLIEQGDWRGGCAKLELSMERFPATSTLLNLANCREHEGKVASAWAMNRRALVLNRETPGERRRRALEEVARAAIERLEPKLPRLEVVLDEPPHGVEARENGRVLPLNTSVPLDPGTIRLTVSAPGYRTWQSSVALAVSERKTVRVQMRRTPPKPAAAPAPVRFEGQAVDGTGTPTWAWITGASGLVFTGAAVGFAIDAKATHDELVEVCGEDLTCDEAIGFDPGPKNARKNRDIGLAVGFGVAGLTAVGVGLAGILTADDPVQVSGWATERGAGVGIRKAF